MRLAAVRAWLAAQRYELVALAAVALIAAGAYGYDGWRLSCVVGGALLLALLIGLVILRSGSGEGRGS